MHFWTTEDEKPFVGQVTHVRCMMCEAEFKIEDIGFVPEELEDIDDDRVYKALDCCGDPVYEMEAHKDQPMFGFKSIDEDYMIHGDAANNERDRYIYNINEDFMLKITEERLKRG